MTVIIWWPVPVVFSQRAVDLAQVRERDSNPLLADFDGVLWLGCSDARMRVGGEPAGMFNVKQFPSHLAIRPYLVD